MAMVLTRELPYRIALSLRIPAADPSRLQERQVTPVPTRMASTSSTRGVTVASSPPAETLPLPGFLTAAAVTVWKPPTQRISAMHQPPETLRFKPIQFINSMSPPPLTPAARSPSSLIPYQPPSAWPMTATRLISTAASSAASTPASAKSSSAILPTPAR